MLEGEHFVAILSRTRSVPSRGDIVLLERPGGGLVTFRVIGLPGETLEIRNKVVLIGGKPLQGDWRVHRDPGTFRERDILEPITIPREHLFVMGDNRDNSSDSRFFGPVPVRALRGRPLLIYWSPQKSRIGSRVK